ncbi:MAG: hypothetical protein K2M55_06265 [Muribaculaceae bacterium]|nr:hypothetical protein [Muribaculaceae bacterium]
MQLKSIEQHIEHLLVAEGAVTVGGLGTFVVHTSPASIDGDELYAPSVQVAFDTCCQADDSLLVSSVMRTDECDTSGATDRCTDAVNRFRQEVELSGRYAVGSLGEFRGEAGAVNFVAADKAVGAGWLKPLTLKPLAVDNPAETAEQVAEAVRRTDFMRSLQRTASAAAAIAVFVLITFVVSQLPSRQNDSRTASIAPSLAVRSVDSHATPVQDSPLVLVLNTPADAACDVEAQDLAGSAYPLVNLDAAPELPAPEVIVGDTPRLGRYVLVVASLATQTEADTYLRRHDDGLRLLESEGRYRIYALTADTYTELQHMADAAGVYDRYPSAWICRR